MAIPLVLVASEVVDQGTPIGATSLTIQDVVVVSLSVPVPTLVNGRPV